MKKVLFLLISIALFASCEKKDNQSKDKGLLDPYATILIRPADGVRSSGEMTALEIVEDAQQIVYQSNYFYDYYKEDADVIRRGFNDQQKDFDIPALKMLAIDVINEKGEYVKTFTHAFDFYIINEDKDSIAYVPDQVIKDARIAIEEAFQQKDYETVYDLFNTAFTFLPLTEKEH